MYPDVCLALLMKVMAYQDLWQGRSGPVQVQGYAEVTHLAKGDEEWLCNSHSAYFIHDTVITIPTQMAGFAHPRVASSREESPFQSLLPKWAA